MRKLAEKYFQIHKDVVENWGDGDIKNVWNDTLGNICIMYESGKWWHYHEKSSGELEWW